jgi:hypothetical protein
MGKAAAVVPFGRVGTEVLATTKDIGFVKQTGETPALRAFRLGAPPGRARASEARG